VSTLASTVMFVLVHPPGMSAECQGRLIIEATDEVWRWNAVEPRVLVDRADLDAFIESLNRATGSHGGHTLGFPAAPMGV